MGAGAGGRGVGKVVGKVGRGGGAGVFIRLGQGVSHDSHTRIYGIFTPLMSSIKHTSMIVADSHNHSHLSIPRDPKKEMQKQREHTSG